MRTQFVQTESLETAENACPWASVIIDVEGGFHAFESVEDFKRFCISGEMATVRATRKKSVAYDAGEFVAQKVNHVLSHNFFGYDLSEASDYLNSYPDFDRDWSDYVDLRTEFPTNLI